MKRFVATIVACLLMGACTLAYQPLRDSTGYAGELLDGGQVRVWYRARATASWESLELALRRYSKELCPTSAPPTRIDRETFVAVAWTEGARPSDERWVSAVIPCAEPVAEVLQRSSVTGL